MVHRNPMSDSAVLVVRNRRMVKGFSSIGSCPNRHSFGTAVCVQDEKQTLVPLVVHAVDFDQVVLDVIQEHVRRRMLSVVEQELDTPALLAQHIEVLKDHGLVMLHVLNRAVQDPRSARIQHDAFPSIKDFQA